ncbi:MAG: DUF4340 domain-containing protein [Opitutaceae bacterium]|jgi:hypothetical protein
MKPKSLLIVVAVLAALSAALFFFKRSTGSPTDDPRAGQPLFDPAVVESASRIEFSENGKTIKLHRTAPGSWVVDSYHNLPADFAKLSTFVGNFTAAKVERFVTANPDRLARLEFKDTHVTLSDDAGKILASLALGKTADGGGRFIQFDSDKKAYLSRLSVWFDTDPKGWADAALIHLKTDDIAKLTVDFPGAAPVVISRPDAKSAFIAAATPDGQRLKSDTVTSLLGTLTGLRFTDTSATNDPKAIGAREAAHTVTLTTFDGQTLTVATGRQPEHTVIKDAAVKPDPGTLLADVAQPTPAEPTPEKSGPVAVLGPVTEKVPAGPVFAFVTHSNASDPVNALMHKRSFQVAEFAFTSLPASPAALFEAVPKPSAAAPAPAAK